MRFKYLAVPLAAAGILSACGDSGTSSSAVSSGGGPGGTGTASSSSSTACVSGTLTVSGSTALQPLVQKAATEYQAQCSGASITVSGGGSSTGLANAASGTSDIGMSDVPVSNARSVDPTTVTDHQVAIVIFGVVVNPKTNVTGLTTGQIQDIFSGKDTNWSQVGGASLPISVIERKPGSGTRLSFDKDVMKTAQETSTPTSTQDSTSLVLTGVQQADGGVSYVNVASAKDVTAVAIDGAKPDAASVAAGKYPFYAHEHMYTKGAGSDLARSFINFINSSTFQAELTTLGFATVSTTSTPAAVDS